MSENYCLILTCTIDVKGVAFMERSNINQRFNDYYSALKMWLESGSAKRIVFVENSGAELSAFKALATKYSEKNVEFISFDGQDFDRGLGKGYGEMLALKRVFETSTLIAQTERFVKINGRYFVPDLIKVSEVMRTGCDVMCDLSKNLTWADSRVFGGTKSFFDIYLLPELAHVNDTAGLYFEHALAKSTHRSIADNLRWELAPFVAIVGVSGTSNELYKRSWIKELVKNVVYQVKKFVLHR